MSLKRILLVGVLAVAGALVLAVGGLMVWKPWIPPVEMTDPAPNGTRVDQAGVLGNFYSAAGGGAHPGVLLLGGSEGALGTSTTRIARALQAEGFSVLHVAYFRAPGQSPRLALVPLETFDRALAWLSAQSGVDRSRLAMVGGSKGAEAALLVATRHPELRAVVAGMPSSVVWPGVDWERGVTTDSSWSSGGKALPALPYGGPSFSGGRRGIYDRGLAALPAHPDTRIPIERSPAAVLLVCGEADSLWPSCPMARQLKASDPARVQILAYADAGRAVFGPPMAVSDPRYVRMAGFGGSNDGNAAARRDGWPKVVAFLHAQLGR
jgi:dienelactone hydrolase